MTGYRRLGSGRRFPGVCHRAPQRPHRAAAPAGRRRALRLPRPRGRRARGRLLFALFLDGQRAAAFVAYGTHDPLVLPENSTAFAARCRRAVTGCPPNTAGIVSSRWWRERPSPRITPPSAGFWPVLYRTSIPGCEFYTPSAFPAGCADGVFLIL